MIRTRCRSLSQTCARFATRRHQCSCVERDFLIVMVVHLYVKFGRLRVPPEVLLEQCVRFKKLSLYEYLLPCCDTTFFLKVKATIV